MHNLAMTQSQSFPESSSHATSSKKKLSNVTPEEMQSLALEASEQAIAAMHAQGVPSIKVVDKQVYKEYPDGHLEFLRQLD